MSARPNRGVRNLAEEIASELFQNGCGQRAERLVLELHGKRDGGGWCKAAVADVIERHLNKRLRAPSSSAPGEDAG